MRALMYSVLTMLLLGLATLALAQNSLLYLEAQGIYGYRSDFERPITYTFMAKDHMQKPSFGFDYLQRITNSDRDIAALSLQFRMAYNMAHKSPFEPQLYNAWLKLKTNAGDVTAGHLRPASGLSYTLDNHAALLYDMTMYNMTYDRDWGALYSKDTSWGNVSFSATNASGMNIYNKRGNYLMAAHASYGVLASDNYNVGVTLQKGVDLVGMGYHFHKAPGTDFPKLHPQMMAGVDGQFRYNNLETAVDVYAGKFLYKPAHSILLRSGINLLPEEKLKLEGQGIWRLFEGKHYVDYEGAVSYKLTPDLTLRGMYDWQNVTAGKDSWRVFGQIYYYTSLF